MDVIVATYYFLKFLVIPEKSLFAFRKMRFYQESHWVVFQSNPQEGQSPIPLYPPVNFYDISPYPKAILPLKGRRMQKKFLFSLGLILGALGAFFWLSDALKNDPSARPPFEHSAFVITRAEGTRLSFTAEVAKSVKEQSYGLMFLRDLPDNQGMIFPYNPPQEVSFWMENTLIPLDMLFVRPDGTLGRIAAEAQPQDRTPISSQEPVIAVIEIKGGMAKKNGLAVGDKVESEAIKATP